MISVPLYRQHIHFATAARLTVAISADGGTLLTGGSDVLARIWNPYLRVHDWDAESQAVVNGSRPDKPVLSRAELNAVFKYEPRLRSVCSGQHESE